MTPETFAAICRRLAREVDAHFGGFGERLRAQQAAAHGVCRDCARPLGGPSPSQICTECHAARVLSKLGGDAGGDA